MGRIASAMCSAYPALFRAAHWVGRVATVAIQKLTHGTTDHPRRRDVVAACQTVYLSIVVRVDGDRDSLHVLVFLREWHPHTHDA